MYLSSKKTMPDTPPASPTPSTASFLLTSPEVQRLQQFESQMDLEWDELLEEAAGSNTRSPKNETTSPSSKTFNEDDITTNLVSRWEEEDASQISSASLADHSEDDWHSAMTGPDFDEVQFEEWFASTYCHPQHDDEDDIVWMDAVAHHPLEEEEIHSPEALQAEVGLVWRQSSFDYSSTVALSNNNNNKRRRPWYARFLDQDYVQQQKHQSRKQNIKTKRSSPRTVVVTDHLDAIHLPSLSLDEQLKDAAAAPPRRNTSSELMSSRGHVQPVPSRGNAQPVSSSRDHSQHQPDYPQFSAMQERWSHTQLEQDALLWSSSHEWMPAMVSPPRPRRPSPVSQTRKHSTRTTPATIDNLELVPSKKVEMTKKVSSLEVESDASSIVLLKASPQQHQSFNPFGCWGWQDLVPLMDHAWKQLTAGQSTKNLEYETVRVS